MPTSIQLHQTQMPGGMGRLDLRDMLLNAGVGSFVAPASIQFMNFLPGTCEPYAQGVIEIVKGLQRLLNAHGAAVVVDGGLGKSTVEALKVFAGPLWYEKSWAQLYTDVMSGKRWKGFKRTSTGRYGNVIERDTAYGAEEGMGSYMHGLGDDAGAWTLRNGVAIPLTAPEVVLFTQLQRQINAINAKTGLSKIGVDGRIGSQTSAAAAAIILKYASGMQAALNALGKTSPSFIAQNAAEISSELDSLMARIGAVYVPDPLTFSTPSVAEADGTVTNPPDGPSPTALVLGAVAIGAAVALFGKKKRRK